MSVCVKALFCFFLITFSSLGFSSEGKLFPYDLLEFRDEPGHFLLIAREANFGEIHVFEARNGRVFERSLLSPTSDSGGKLNLYVGNGIRIFLPNHGTGSRASNNLIININERFAPSVTYPDRPRELLEYREITQESLSRIGVLDQLDPKHFTPRQSAPSEPDPTFLLHPESSSLIVITSKRESDGSETWVSEEARRAISKILKGYDSTKVALLKSENGALVIACDDSLSMDLVKNLLSLEEDVSADLNVETIPRFELNSVLPFDPFGRGKEFVLEAIRGDLRLPTRMKIVLALLETDLEKIVSTSEDKSKLAKELVDFLFELDGIFMSVFNSVFYELYLKLVNEGEGQSEGDWERIRSEAKSSVDSHLLFQRFAKPLQFAETKVLEVLDRLQTPESRQFVLSFAGKGMGAGFPLITRRNTQGEIFYLDYWLNWMKTSIERSSSIDPTWTPQERNQAGWWKSNSMGRIHDQLGTDGVMTYWFQLGVGSYRPQAGAPFHPLVLLGLSPDARAVKKKILQFILESEETIAEQLVVENRVTLIEEFMRVPGFSKLPIEVVEKFVETGTLSDENIAELQSAVGLSGRPASMRRSMKDLRKQIIERFNNDLRVTVNQITYQLIQALASPDSSFLGYPHFSIESYYANVLDIFIELIETSRISLKVDGTYHTALDVALGLIKRIESRYGLDGHENQEIARKAVRLSLAIQDNFLSSLQALQRTQAEACAQFLRPDPFKKP